MKTPTESSELLSTDTLMEGGETGNWGQRLKKKKNEEGEKQISTNLFLRADLESGGHKRRGGNIPEAYTAQPYSGVGIQGIAHRQEEGYAFLLTLALASREGMRGV